MASTPVLAQARSAARVKNPNYLRGLFMMTAIIIVLGFFLIYPVLVLIINSFNVAPEFFVPPRQWGLDNWRTAFQEPGLLKSLGHTVLIWGFTVGISFPLAVAIAWLLARTNVPFSHGLEFMFWVSFMMPGIASTVGWIMLLDPDVGIGNKMIEWLPFVDRGPFNIFSIPGIVWAHLMANGISIKVMLLTPAFRNMDATMEEAGRVSGASAIGTLFRVTLPLMVPPMVLVFALQLIRIFQSFETEQLLGVPFNFFVYSTMIFSLARDDPPQYGAATALAVLTLAIVAVIIPFQRWILQRKRYTTLTGQFKPGLIDLGPWRLIVFAVIAILIVGLTAAPVVVLGLGSFMTRAGYFNLNTVFTLKHWNLVLTDPLFIKALKTTVTLALTAAIVSPLLFSILAYILVRTKLPGRFLLDTMIWVSGAVPGILVGLGLLQLFLFTPGLVYLFGTIWALIIVVVLQGNTSGTNIAKGVFVQVGQELEEAARISGASWIRTYFRVWVPLLMPTLILLGIMNFVFAAGATSQVILLADRNTTTLSIMALEFMSDRIGLREEAGIISLFIVGLTVGVAVIARHFGAKVGVRHERARSSRQSGAERASITQAT